MNELKHHIESLKSQEPAVRNQAAIAIMDSGDPNAVPFLIEAIECIENRQARGTLIYALSGFDCSGRFTQLFGWACQGGFEATCEALSIIRDQDIKPSEVDVALCERRLAALVSGGCSDELVSELAELICTPPR